MSHIKLNLGCGDCHLDGYINLDRKNGYEVFPLKAADSSVDEIRASHVLEHLSFADANKALSEWHRVLKPTGKLYISVPDTQKIASRISESDTRWRYYLLGGQTDADDFHRSCWTASTLQGALIAAGFDHVMDWQSDGLDTSAHEISLNLQASKGAEIEDIKIAAVMSLPRLGWNDTWGCIVDAFRPFGIPIRRYTGAFWGQCLQSVLEDCIVDGLDWVICLDYDSVFTYRDIDRLLGTFGQNPHIDALAALQPKRNDGTPLMTIKGKTGVEVDGNPIKVDTAHFGLTMIRLDALRKASKPWFVGVPGPDGTWTHKDHLDPDIYFWKVWREAGNSVYVDPAVRLGHLELFVSQFDESLELHRHTVKSWRERTKDES